MLQSAAVWRLTHTADRITQSEYENPCCSPEPSAKSTGPGSGQSCLFTGEVDSNVEWLTILLGQLHMAMITCCDRNVRTRMGTQTVNNWDKSCSCLKLRGELFQNLKKGDYKVRRFNDLYWFTAGDAGLVQRLSWLVLDRCSEMIAQQAATQYPHSLLNYKLAWILHCKSQMDKTEG